MQSGITPEQRTICLIPIPFTDLSSSKKRPVLIISNDHYNQSQYDILVMGITSNVINREYSYLIDESDMETGTLIHASMVRVDKIYSISKSLVIKSFGKICQATFDAIIDRLNSLVK